MRAKDLKPVCYAQFYKRITTMNLHDAIYSPRVEYRVRTKRETPIQDKIRRHKRLMEDNIPVLELDELLEKRGVLVEQKRVEVPEIPTNSFTKWFRSLFKRNERSV